MSPRLVAALLPLPLAACAGAEVPVGGTGAPEHTVVPTSLGADTGAPCVPSPEVWGDRVDQSCGGDGDGATFADEAVALHGETASDFAGRAVATVDDIDGDDLPELLVSALGTDGAMHTAAYVVFGAPTADMSLGDADIRFTAREADGSGQSASAGDIDGDGRVEVALGAPNWGDEGAVFLLPAWRSGTVDVDDGYGALLGVASGDAAGADVRFVGDLDGDRRDELVVIASKADGGVRDSSAAYVVSNPGHGSVSLEDAIAITPSHAPSVSVAGGDIDGDGLGDLVVGWSGRSLGSATLQGAVYVYYGPPRPGDLDTMADVRIPATTPWTQAGRTVATLGDLDGDGRDDIAATGYVSAGTLWSTQQGQAWIVTSLDIDRLEDAPSRYLARSSQFGDVRAGDVDGDGTIDLLLGEPYHDTAAGYAGAVHVVVHKSPGTRDLAHSDGTVRGASFTQAGWSLAAHDADGDGLVDLFASAPGADGAAANAGLVWFLPGR